MAQSVTQYEAAHPNITIDVVPQSTDTLQSAFETAAASHSGPDIASEWATGGTLGYVLSGYDAPISDLIPQSETQHWLNTSENTFNGKIWTMPMYLLGTSLAYNKALFAQAGVTPPSGDRWTWDEFLAACAKLKAAGITPLVGGDKDGYLGGWLFSLIGSQQLNSPMDLVQATVGNASFTDAKYTGWYTALDTLVKDGYWNDDVLSRNLDQGVTLFGQGGGAMSFESDGMLATSIKVLGGDKVGLMLPPTWGTGKMADYGYATQSCGYAVTSWSKHQQQAADFLAYLHTPDRLTAWYEATGVTPADDRFDTSLVTVPQLQTATKFDTTGSQAFLEEWLPVEIDGNADLPAGEMIFGGSGTPSDAAQLWERSAQEWRTAHPDELAGWQKMAGTQ